MAAWAVEARTRASGGCVGPHLIFRDLSELLGDMISWASLKPKPASVLLPRPDMTSMNPASVSMNTPPLRATERGSEKDPPVRGSATSSSSSAARKGSGRGRRARGGGEGGTCDGPDDLAAPVEHPRNSVSDLEGDGLITIVVANAADKSHP